MGSKVADRGLEEAAGSWRVPEDEDLEEVEEEDERRPVIVSQNAIVICWRNQGLEIASADAELCVNKSNLTGGKIKIFQASLFG